jgi:hypothetical protein
MGTINNPARLDQKRVISSLVHSQSMSSASYHTGHNGVLVILPYFVDPVTPVTTRKGIR